MQLVKTKRDVIYSSLVAIKLHEKYLLLLLEYLLKAIKIVDSEIKPSHLKSHEEEEPVPLPQSMRQK